MGRWGNQARRKRQRQKQREREKRDRQERLDSRVYRDLEPVDAGSRPNLLLVCAAFVLFAGTFTLIPLWWTRHAWVGALGLLGTFVCVVLSMIVRDDA